MTTTTNHPGHAPDTLTGAELATLRESCGLLREDLARMLQVEPRTVKHWEHGRSGVPDDVARQVQQMARAIDEAAAQALRVIHQQARRLANSSAADVGPLDVVLIRYRTDDDLHRHRPDMRGFPTAAHGAIVRSVADAIRRSPDLQPYACARVVWMDREAYEAWRAAQPGRPADTELTHSEWAAAQAIDQQARPHRRDQPPPDFAPAHTPQP
jgi:transcriptional regulator with XRE-family HTH domain